MQQRGEINYLFCVSMPSILTSNLDQNAFQTNISLIVHYYKIQNANLVLGSPPPLCPALHTQLLGALPARAVPLQAVTPQQCPQKNVLLMNQFERLFLPEADTQSSH